MAETAVSAVENGAGKPADRRPADPRRGPVRAGPGLRRLRPQRDRLGGAVADQDLAPAAAGVHDGVSVVEHRHHGRRAVGRADRRPFRAQAAAHREPDDFRRRLAGERLRRLARHADVLRFFTGLGIGGGVLRRGVADRRLHAGAPARADDHGELHRRADRRVCRRPDRRAVLLPNFGWPSRSLSRRLVSAGPGAGDGALAAGVAAFSAGRASRLSARDQRHCCSASTSPRRAVSEQPDSTSPRATRSRCCSARATRCRPCCCGSSISAA